MPRSATRGLGRSFNVLTTSVLAPGSDHPRGTCATSTPSRQHMSTRNEVQSSGTEQPRAPRALRLERIQGTTSRSGGRAPPTRAVVWPQTIRESGHLRPSRARPEWADDRALFFSSDVPQLVASFVANQAQREPDPRGRRQPRSRQIAFVGQTATARRRLLV